MDRTKKKIILTAVFLLMTVLTFTFSTVAYFTDSTSSSGSHISTGDMRVKLVETVDENDLMPNGSMRILPGYVVSRELAVKNVGSLPVYVRVRVDSLITLAAAMQGREGEIDPALVKLNINTTDWELHGDYYYHKNPVVSGNSTAPLFTTVTFDPLMGNLYKDSSIELDFTVHALQANSNGTSYLDASGWPEETGGQG